MRDWHDNEELTHSSRVALFSVAQARQMGHQAQNCCIDIR